MIPSPRNGVADIESGHEVYCATVILLDIFTDNFSRLTINKLRELFDI